VLLLGLDFETGGSFEKPLEENFITEVGAVLWDTDIGQPVKMMNKLVYQGKPIAEEATLYTGITNEMVAAHGEPLEPVLLELLQMCEQAEYIVAQNGLLFDKPLLKLECAATGLIPPTQMWLDTTCDIDYPANCRQKNLAYLAAFHLILNCFPHRAVTDVLTMMTIFQKYELAQIIKNAASPTLLVRALVTFGDKEKAKKAGFYWEGQEKFWLKNVRKDQFYEWAQKLDFKTAIIKEETREGAPVPAPEGSY
jgi:DNA polymerase-3 subunit epsilon